MAKHAKNEPDNVVTVGKGDMVLYTPAQTDPPGPRTELAAIVAGFGPTAVNLCVFLESGETKAAADVGLFSPDAPDAHFWRLPGTDNPAPEPVTEAPVEEAAADV